MTEYLTRRDDLDIVCEIEDVRKVHSEKFEIPVTKRLSMVKNFDKFWMTGEFCDVQFILKNCDGNSEIIEVHKLVLMGVSNYFLGMFSNSTSESKVQVLDWSNKNITFEAFEAFLEYIYGVKTIEDIKELAFELMMLGDKFDVKELISACEVLVLDDINEENIGRNLLFSKKHNCKVLLERAILFSRSCLTKLVISKEFPELAKDRSLMAELF
ncbi:BTB/POZ domain-containing protein At1g21780-like [Copidosoma floridanum]|uniref:BTB/POZ domain-containing protein At1g21780-like n=1 Tax=Copidosoma floridanum TaxID=29053 RepID=UPI0006C95BE5|nr:BTB/POZ domain-containing protein At1g21780-like [Copidosoma floridanum]